MYLEDFPYNCGIGLLVAFYGGDVSAKAVAAKMREAHRRGFRYVMATCNNFQADKGTEKALLANGFLLERRGWNKNSGNKISIYIKSFVD